MHHMMRSQPRMIQKKTRERKRGRKKREEKGRKKIFVLPSTTLLSIANCTTQQHNNASSQTKEYQLHLFFLFLVDFIVYLRFIQRNHSLPFVLSKHLSQFPVFSGPSLSLFRHGRSVLHYLVFLLFSLYMHSTKFEYLVYIPLCLILFQLKWLLLPFSLRIRLLFQKRQYICLYKQKSHE